jgi:hypothetical protein
VDIDLHHLDFAMPLYECDECARLWALYVDAEAARNKAEANLTKANLSRDAARINAARQEAKSTMDRWCAADGAVREHRRSHVMTAETMPHL